MSTQFLCAIATVHGVFGALKMPPRPDHAAESACHVNSVAHFSS
jgi:hypothetical protein